MTSHKPVSSVYATEATLDSLAYSNISIHSSELLQGVLPPQQKHVFQEHGFRPKSVGGNFTHQSASAGFSTSAHNLQKSLGFCGELPKFDPRNFLDRLTPAKEKNKYICPVCGGHNLGIDPKTGKYSCFNGCENKDVREAIRPWSEVLGGREFFPTRKSAAKRITAPAPLPQGSIKIPLLDVVPEDIPPQCEPLDSTPKRIYEQFTRAGATLEELKEVTETIYEYGDGKKIHRYDCPCEVKPKGRVKTFAQTHVDENGIPRWGKGSDPWGGYRLDEAIRLANNQEGIKVLVLQEGEKCVEIGRGEKIVSFTLQGSNWKSEIPLILERIKEEVTGQYILVHLYDPDKTGISKRDLAFSNANRYKIPFVFISTKDILATISDTGDIEEILSEMETPDFIKRLEEEIQFAVNRRIEDETKDDWDIDEIPDFVDFNNSFEAQAYRNLFGDTRWICVQDKLHKHIGNYYEYIPDDIIIPRIAEFCENFAVFNERGQVKYPYTNAASVNRVLAWVKSRTKIDPRKVNPPGVNCTNGILRPKIVEARVVVEFLEHSPDEYYLYKPLVTYDPNADTTQVERLLLCLEKPEREILIRNLGASLNLAEVRKLRGREVRAILACGLGSNGKDALRQVTSVIFGHSGITSISLGDFIAYDEGRKFALSGLMNSRVNWASENLMTCRIDKIQSLKIYITGNQLHAERKGRDHIEFTPEGIAIFNLNEVPAMHGVIQAILDRIAIVNFLKTFKKKPDPKNPNELLADPRFSYDEEFVRTEVAPAFLNLMVKGLIDLVEEGIDYSSTESALSGVQKENNHLFSFIEDVGLGYKPESDMSAKELFALVEHWYQEQGTLTIDEKGKRIWVDQARPSDKNIKGMNQVLPRIKALFPKAELGVKYCQIQKRNIKVLKGIGVVEKSDSTIENNDSSTAPATVPENIDIQAFRATDTSFHSPPDIGKENHQQLECTLHEGSNLTPKVSKNEEVVIEKVAEIGENPPCLGVSGAETIEDKGDNQPNWCETDASTGATDTQNTGIQSSSPNTKPEITQNLTESNPGNDQINGEENTTPDTKTTLLNLLLLAWDNPYQLGDIVLAAKEEELQEVAQDLTNEQINHLRDAANQAWKPGLNRDVEINGERAEIWETGNGNIWVKFHTKGNKVKYRRPNVRPWLGIFPRE